MTATESDRRLGQLAVLPDPSGLLAAIMLSPESDTERLLYADWLDEEAGHATERAEYIRCHVVSRQTEGAESHRLANRTCELYRVVIEPLIIGWATHPRLEDGNSSPHMDRGFLNKIACSWEDWLRHGDALRAREWLPKVKLTTSLEIETLTVTSRDVKFSFPGRPVRVLNRPGDVVMDAAMEKEALEIEWPGTEFETTSWGAERFGLSPR
jgi:uncharacterized protein (TIGR02996 family)